MKWDLCRGIYRSYLDALLFKRKAFGVRFQTRALSLSSHSGWWEGRTEGGAASLVQCPGAPSPALMFPDSAAAPGRIGAMARSICNVKPTTHCIDLLCFALERNILFVLRVQLRTYSFQQLVQFDAFFYNHPPFTDLMNVCHSFHSCFSAHKENAYSE